VLSAYLQSQTVEPKFDQLSVTIPSCVLHDSYGFIWIGAQEGLIRYDGYQLKKYTQIPFDSTTLSINWVTAIKEDNIGNLWIGTLGGGLNYFDQKTEKFTHYQHHPENENTIGSNNITNLVVNEDGSLWIGTMDNGLVQMNKDSSRKAIFTRFNLDSGKKTRIPSGENFVLGLYKDHQGMLWIGTMQGGLKRLNPETAEITHFKYDPDDPSSLNDNTVSSICEDDFGNIWIGTGHITEKDGGGLNKFVRNTEQFISYKHDPRDPVSLCSNRISSMVIDRQNILWI
jgi:ligand-binding sensor domain-containing protein